MNGKKRRVRRRSVLVIVMILLPAQLEGCVLGGLIGGAGRLIGGAAVGVGRLAVGAVRGVGGLLFGSVVGREELAGRVSGGLPGAPGPGR